MFDPTFKVEHFLTALTILVAILVAYVAYNQFVLAKDKFKLDLFEKRFAIYQGVQSFLSDILRGANVTNERIVQFRQETQNSIYLFQDDIPIYLDQVANKAIELYVNGTKQKTSEVIRIQTELLSWFADQITGQNPRLIKNFSPYLKFQTWK
jgi:hypothetical protein